MSLNENLIKGLFLVIEGIDGAGKSTQVNMLSDKLKSRGYDTVVTKEPTEEFTYGRAIRESMYEGGRFPVQKELELFMLDRKEHLNIIVRPALDEKKIVVCDRYYYSNMAYQGASGIDMDEIRRKNEEFAVIPDAVFYLDIDAEEGLDRVKNVRNSPLTSFEDKEFLKRVSENFSKMDFDYFHTIDAKRSADEVSGDMMKIAEKIILKNRSNSN